MFDLVNRLRNRAKNWQPDTADAMLDNAAADEIAKLQADTAVLRAAMSLIRKIANAVDDE
jgi:hypothetical protein